jgi:DNA repair protein RecO
MPSYKSKCVILKTYNLGETDRIIKLFSQDKGMIDSVAKGARKIRSKFGGRLELYNFIECELSRGKSLDVITQAEIIKSFKNIPSDFNKFLFCQLISEFILKTHLAGSENAPLIFRLLYVCFNEIDLTPSEDICPVQKVAVFFIARFMKLTGYAPLLGSCSRCGAGLQAGAWQTKFPAAQSETIKGDNNQGEITQGPITQDPITQGKVTQGTTQNVFSVKHGGLLCRNCAAAVQNYPDLKKIISARNLDFLKKLFVSPLKNLRQEVINPEELDEISVIIGDYIRYHTDCNIDIRLYLDRVLP